MFGDIFKDLEIKDEYLRPYKPTEEQKAAAGVDRFLEKDLFNLIDSSKKIVDDFRMIRPKMTAFVLQSITPAGEKKIKERYRPEWTKCIIVAVQLLTIISFYFGAKRLWSEGIRRITVVHTSQGIR